MNCTCELKKIMFDFNQNSVPKEQFFTNLFKMSLMTEKGPLCSNNRAQISASVTFLNKKISVYPPIYMHLIFEISSSRNWFLNLIFCLFSIQVQINKEWSLMDHGGFQLEFISTSRVINHMTCYKSSALIGWNQSIQTGDQIL